MQFTTPVRLIRRLAGAGLAVAALSGAAFASGIEVLLTDPVLLEKLGFDPGARNVYATVQAQEELTMDPAERAALYEVAGAQRRAAREQAPATGTFGSTTPGYTAISSHVFNPARDTTQFTRSSGGDPGGGLFCIGGPASFIASLDAIPHGARLSLIDFWYYDISPENISFTVYRTCHPDLGPGDGVVTVLGSTASTGAPGLAFRWINLSGSPHHADTQSCTYSLSVRLDDQGGATSCSEGADLQVMKARVEWIREISPAPGTATFGDVPTGHPFFRYVEALQASGITGGCGGGNFCPNSPLTRGQMAVFLAAALGLHWGSF